MSKGGGGGAQTTTQSNMPPAYALPGFQAAASAAQNLYNSKSYVPGGQFDAAAYLAANPDVARDSYYGSRPEAHYNKFGKAEGRQGALTQAVDNTGNDKYFSGSTVVDFSQQSEDALNQQEALARGGSPMIDAAQAQNLKMINGEYLDPASNPYLQAMIDQTSRDTIRNFKTGVTPQIDSAFNNAGRFGSQAFANAGGQAKTALAQELGDISTNINYQNYAAERGYQNAAIGNAGAIDDLKYNPSRVLAQVGALRDAQAQEKLNDDVARYEYERDAPVRNLNTFISQLAGTAGNYGTQTGTTTAPKKGGGLSSLIGAATSLGGAYLSSGLGSAGGLSPYQSMGTSGDAAGQVINWSR